MTDCDGLITNLRNANNAARIDLEAIKARAEAATEGPWHVEALAHRVDIDSAMGAWLFRRCVDVECSVDLPWDEFVEAARNAVFIAHARTDVPALVAEVERLRADNERIWAEAIQRQQLADNAHTYDLDVLRAEVERLRAIEARP